jgi:hypothetical protein
MVMVPPSRLLAALLCGLLVTGCNGTRGEAVTLHVHLDAALVAALPEPADDADRQLEVGVVMGSRDPDVCLSHPHHPALRARGGCCVPCPSGSLTLDGLNLGSGRDAGIALLAVVVVVVVGVAVWKIGQAVSAPHAAAPVTIYALTLGGGSQPTQLLHLRDGQRISLDAVLVDALEHGGYSRATLQRSGSPVALPVLVVLDGPQLSVRPVGAVRSR